MRAALLALLLCAAGWDVARAECASPDVVTARVAAEAPNAAPLTVSGAAADDLAAHIGEFIGADVPDGGAYIVFDDPAMPRVYVVRFENGCATHHGFFTAAMVREWIAGRPS